VEVDGTYEIIKKGRTVIRNEGVGLSYAPDDVVGTLVITQADEEVALGNLTRSGFFDRIENGDEVILQSQKQSDPAVPESTADPELRTLLRTLR
jgi:hypothetical protein